MDADAPATLTDQQAEFCRQYLLDFNASRAARAAGYSAATAHGHAHELLKNVDIAACIQRLIKERAERTMVSADRVVIELAAVAFSNHNHYLADDAGNVTLAEGTDPMAIHAVASVKRKLRKLGKGDDAITEAEVEVKLWDKPAALKMLMLHLGMIEKKMLVAGDPDKPIKSEAKWTGGISLTAEDIRAARELVAHLDDKMPGSDVVANTLRSLGLPVPGESPSVAP